MKTLYLELVDWNGTQRNKRLRRLSRETLNNLIAYADTQPHLPHSNVNLIAADARRELARR